MTLLDEIRRLRHKISERIGHNPQRIAEYYAKLQCQHSDRIVNLSGEAASEHVKELLQAQHADVPTHSVPHG